MTTRSNLILVAVLVTSTCLPAEAQKQQWTTNMPAALKRAQADGKDLLLNFTGSDWCSWCHELEGQVFETDEFRKAAPKNFVLVTLDFPVDQSRQDPKLAKQNHEWLRKLRVDGFPTVVLCDATGRPYALTGYEEGGPKPYLKMLDKFRAARVMRDRLFAEARDVKSVQRAQKLDAALGLMEDSVVAKYYASEVDQILKLAGADSKLAGKYAAIKLSGQQEAAMLAMDELFMMNDASKAIKKIAELDKLFPPKGEMRDEFEINRMMLLSQFKREEAVSIARQMLDDRGHGSPVALTARSLMLDALLKKKRYAELLKTVAEWEKADDFPSEMEPELRLYRVQGLHGENKTDEAIAEAKRLLTAGQIGQSVGEEVNGWLRLFIEKRGAVPPFNEYVGQGYGGPTLVSDFWIGLTIDELGADRREELQIPDGTGFVLAEVFESGPAEKSGLKENDILTTVNGQPLQSSEQLTAAIAAAADKSPIQLERIRAGATEVVSIVPKKRPNVMARTEIELAAVPDYWLQDFDEATRLAKQESKELVLFFTAKWCGPCQAMLKETMRDVKVEAELRKRVVVYIDVDSDEGSAVASKFEVNALPGYLFLDSQANELGRAMGFVAANEFRETLKHRGAADGFDVADANGDGVIRLREFRRYAVERLGEGLPLRKIFRKIDKDDSGSLSKNEFDERLQVIEKFISDSAVEAYPDPGADFVPYVSATEPVDDALVFGALVHRYADLLQSDKPWPAVDLKKVPKAIRRPDLSSAKPCESVQDLARASLIIAGGDDEKEGFFSSGAVLVSADGLALTNYHVIETIGESKLMAMDSLGKAHRIVEVLAGSKERDIALIRVEGQGFPAVKIAAAAPPAGDDLRMMHHSELRFFTYDRGYVMRYTMVGKQPWMQVSAEYAPGGSGCGLFNRQHELVGLVSSITMGDGPDLAGDDSFENEDSELEEWGEDESVSFGMLVVKHAVPLSAIEALWKKE